MKLRAVIKQNNSETYEEWVYQGDLTEEYLQTQLNDRSASFIELLHELKEEGAPYSILGVYDPNAS